MGTGDLLEALPIPDRWDFGGHPYGLEPLTLPRTAASLGDREEGTNETGSADLESSRLSLRAIASVRDPALSPIPDPVERLFWFRWITGHQTTFILWQLLAQVVKHGASDEEVAAADQESCRVFICGYSAMLLYTGSCTREIYHRVIRPGMILQHPGFSGSWARDFWPVRGMLRAGGGEPPDTPLGRERALNVLIHEGIAEKLVPGGRSLLKSVAGQPGMTWKRSTLAVIYDTYFLTLRAAVPHEVVLRQLMRRLHAIGRDLAANGLYPAYASSADERPESLRSAWVEECEQTIAATLFAIATQVAGGARAYQDSQ